MNKNHGWYLSETWWPLLRLLSDEDVGARLAHTLAEAGWKGVAHSDDPDLVKFYRLRCDLASRLVGLVTNPPNTPVPWTGRLWIDSFGFREFDFSTDGTAVTILGGMVFGLLEDAPTELREHGFRSPQRSGPLRASLEFLPDEGPLIGYGVKFLSNGAPWGVGCRPGLALDQPSADDWLYSVERHREQG